MGFVVGVVFNKVKLKIIENSQLEVLAGHKFQCYVTNAFRRTDPSEILYAKTIVACGSGSILAPWRED